MFSVCDGGEATAWELSGGLLALMTAVTAAGFRWPWDRSQVGPRLLVLECGLTLVATAACHPSTSVAPGTNSAPPSLNAEAPSALVMGKFYDGLLAGLPGGWATEIPNRLGSRPALISALAARPLTRAASASRPPDWDNVLFRETADCISVPRRASSSLPGDHRSFWQASALASPVSPKASPGIGPLLSQVLYAELPSGCPLPLGSFCRPDPINIAHTPFLVSTLIYIPSLSIPTFMHAVILKKPHVYSHFVSQPLGEKCARKRYDQCKYRPRHVNALESDKPAI
jgi:hypothetical protein